MRRLLPVILGVIVLLLPLAARADCQHRRLEKITDQGRTVELDDGSRWQVSDVDQGTAANWQQDSTITACENELINTEEHEIAQARQTVRGEAIPEAD